MQSVIWYITTFKINLNLQLKGMPSAHGSHTLKEETSPIQDENVVRIF